MDLQKCASREQKQHACPPVVALTLGFASTEHGNDGPGDKSTYWSSQTEDDEMTSRYVPSAADILLFYFYVTFFSLLSHYFRVFVL